MKKAFLQFLAAAAGAVAGGAAFAVLWQHIDRFFYVTLGIDIQCDGCHTEALSLLYMFVPCAAALFVFICTRILYKSGGIVCLMKALLGSVFIGGTLCLFAVQIAQGEVAAVLVVCIMAATATAGCNFGGRLNAQAPASAGE